jgi:hypothetical protein
VPRLEASSHPQMQEAAADGLAMPPPRRGRQQRSGWRQMRDMLKRQWMRPGGVGKTC